MKPKIWAIALLWAVLGPALANTRCTNATAVEAHPYIVSGILKKHGEEATIKLVHTVERAVSQNEALGAFLTKALHDFPGYAVATTLVSPVAIPTTPTCARPGGVVSV